MPTAVDQGDEALVCEKRLPNIFVLFWCYENLDSIRSIADGSIFAKISKKVFRPIPATVPSKQTLTAYEGIVRPPYDCIVANTKEAVSFAQILDLLLPKLISGGIHFPDAEKAVRAMI